jgi:hypothetical protein
MLIKFYDKPEGVCVKHNPAILNRRSETVKGNNLDTPLRGVYNSQAISVSAVNDLPHKIKGPARSFSKIAYNWY